MCPCSMQLCTTQHVKLTSEVIRPDWLGWYTPTFAPSTKPCVGLPEIDKRDDACRRIIREGTPPTPLPAAAAVAPKGSLLAPVSAVAAAAATSDMLLRAEPSRDMLREGACVKELLRETWRDVLALLLMGSGSAMQRNTAHSLCCDAYTYALRAGRHHMLPNMQLSNRLEEFLWATRSIVKWPGPLAGSTC